MCERFIKWVAWPMKGEIIASNGGEEILQNKMKLAEFSWEANSPQPRLFVAGSKHHLLISLVEKKIEY